MSVRGQVGALQLTDGEISGAAITVAKATVEAKPAFLTSFANGPVACPMLLRRAPSRLAVHMVIEDGTNHYSRSSLCSFATCNEGSFPTRAYLGLVVLGKEVVQRFGYEIMHRPIKLYRHAFELLSNLSGEMSGNWRCTIPAGLTVRLAGVWLLRGGWRRLRFTASASRLLRENSSQVCFTHWRIPNFVRWRQGTYERSILVAYESFFLLKISFLPLQP
jgi:hypothetical protein